MSEIEDEINFCPYCNAAQHKLLYCKDSLIFCRDCSRFFKFEGVKLKCPKCGKNKITKSDFPAPSGEPIFQCKACRKMCSASEFFKENDII